MDCSTFMMGNAPAEKKFGLRTIIWQATLFSGSPVGYALPEGEEISGTFLSPILNTLQASFHQTGRSMLASLGEFAQRFGYRSIAPGHRRR